MGSKGLGKRGEPLLLVLAKGGRGGHIVSVLPTSTTRQKYYILPQWMGLLLQCHVVQWATRGTSEFNFNNCLLENLSF